MAGIMIGMKNIYYALLITDPVGGSPTYTTPKKLSGALSASINPNPNKATLFGDDGPMEVASVLGQIDLELGLADVSLDDQAILLGHSISAGVITRKSADVAPWVAVGFESTKSTGKRRFVWLVKGKFQEIETKSETKGDSVNFQTPTLNGSFVKRDSDDVWQYSADEDSPGFLAGTATNWYVKVYDGTAPTALTVTPVPANAASAVVATAPITLTFSAAINPAFMTLDYIGVYKTAGMVQASGTLSINAGNTIVTFTPSPALTAATPYTIKVDRQVGMAADFSSTFTTA